MRRTSALAALVACVAAGCGGGDDDTDDSDDTVDAGTPGATWEPAFERLEGSFLSSVWGSGPDDVFVVGGNRQRGEVHHFDGQGWSVELVEEAQMFVWAHGFSSTSVYAVGLAGTAYHYDGDSWQSIGYPGDEDLWGIWGASEDDLWIVGGSVAEGEPVLTHYDGQTFTPTALDAEQNPLGTHALFKVWGAGDHVVAVGQLGLVLVRDGESWTRAPAGENADDDFIALSGTTAEDVVLVGGRNSARVATAQGDAFETVKPERTAGLAGVAVDGDAVYVGGLGGVVGQFDRATGQVTTEGFVSEDVHAMWGDGGGTIYAVGGFPGEPFTGIAYARRETE
jgi:hypothetical protein